MLASWGRIIGVERHVLDPNLPLVADPEIKNYISALNSSRIAMASMTVNDDIKLVARSKSSLGKVFKGMEEKSKEVGLIINDSKTQYMIASHPNRPCNRLQNFQGDINLQVPWIFD